MKMTQEHKDKIGLAAKKNWAQQEYRDRVVFALQGHIVSKSQRKKISKSLMKKGLPYCLSCGKQLSDYRNKKCFQCFNTERVGEKNPAWKGGITPKNQTIRVSIDYQLWRIAVYERDGFCCQCCGKVGKNLHAHHILAFAKYPKLRFEANNGITLCKQCHELLHRRKICSRNSV